jgi:hypothetical protein
MARAAARLDMAVQTVSAQVRLLEQSLGYALFKPAGRGMALTEAGVAAMALADQIFQLGEQLPAAVREAATGQGCGWRSASPTACPSWWCATCCSRRWTTARAPAVPRGRIRPLLATWRCTGSTWCCPIARRRPIPTCACTATRWAKRRWRGSRRWRWRASARSPSRPAWPTCRCCCPPAMPPCGRGWTSGSSARKFARAWRASSRTAPCWPPSAAAAWAPSRPPAGRTRNC